MLTVQCFLTTVNKALAHGFMLANVSLVATLTVAVRPKPKIEDVKTNEAQASNCGKHRR